MYDLLWYIKLWFKGLFIMFLAPVVFLFRFIFELPVLIAKKYQSEE